MLDVPEIEAEPASAVTEIDAQEVADDSDIEAIVGNIGAHEGLPADAKPPSSTELPNMIVSETEVAYISDEQFVAAGGATGPEAKPSSDSGKSLEDLERESIIEALKETAGLDLSKVEKMPSKRLRLMANILIDGFWIADESELGPTLRATLLLLAPKQFTPRRVSDMRLRDMKRALVAELNKRGKKQLAGKLESARESASVPPAMPKKQ